MPSKKRGRPPIDNPRSGWIKIRVSPDEARRIEQAAGAARATVSEHVRARAMEGEMKATEKSAREFASAYNYCRDCGSGVTDLDAGFSPAALGMRCKCGGLYRRPSIRAAREIMGKGGGD